MAVLLRVPLALRTRAIGVCLADSHGCPRGATVDPLRPCVLWSQRVSLAYASSWLRGL